MEKIYNKLVRDHIPEKIRSTGQNPVVKVLDDSKYLDALNKKLQEEVSEYLKDNCLEELCDILEVVYAIAKIKGYTHGDIETRRNNKNIENGAFENKLFLEKVTKNLDVSIYPLDKLGKYRFVVIFARYQNKWLYCRAKERDTFETAGGQIEKGETPIEAAKRELFEETGAIKFDIKPAFDYSVRRSAEISNGQVLLAHIHKLGDIPDYEMAEIKLFDTIPNKMRFSDILPVLFYEVKKIVL